LNKRKGFVELTIANDGADFSLKPKRNKGLGLHIMTYRANVLRGELSVTRRHPRGTLVKCLFKTGAAR
jgi:nitrate/nitrite-specific signal transduction histidine kinase